MKRLVLVISILALGGCPAPSEAPSTASAVSGADSAVPPERILSEAEYALVKADLEDLRAGVRPFSDSSLGVCDWKDESCATYLGMDAGELPEGEYLFYAEMRAPKMGPETGYPITFSTDCETTTESGSNSSKSSKDYNVRYAGKERGYRLKLRKITSPGKYATKCSWQLDAGENTFSGSWSVPAKSE